MPTRWSTRSRGRSSGSTPRRATSCSRTSRRWTATCPPGSVRRGPDLLRLADIADRRPLCEHRGHLVAAPVDVEEDVQRDRRNRGGGDPRLEDRLHPRREVRVELRRGDGDDPHPDRARDDHEVRVALVLDAAQRADAARGHGADAVVSVMITSITMNMETIAVTP